jgi:DNA-binding LacI/PurR family transcriptional regulator
VPYLIDVAKRANVSIATVYATFTGGSVSKGTRQRVLDAAQAVGYTYVPRRRKRPRGRRTG